MKLKGLRGRNKEYNKKMKQATVDQMKKILIKDTGTIYIFSLKLLRVEDQNKNNIQNYKFYFSGGAKIS